MSDFCVSSCLRCAAIALVLLLIGLVPDVGMAQPGKAEIRESVNRGVAYIKSIDEHEPDHLGIIIYTLLKAGVDKSDPYLKGLVEDLERKFNEEGEYEVGKHHNYEAGTDLMALEAYDAQLYKPQMESIVQYIDEMIQPYGAWYYPQHVENELGDTSITQYALLGLWAARRAGVKVHEDLWARAGVWHLRTQLPDGRFRYHPGDGRGPTESMSLAGLGSLGLIRMMVGGQKKPEPKKESPKKPEQPMPEVVEEKKPNSDYVRRAKQNSFLVAIDEEKEQLEEQKLIEMQNNPEAVKEERPEVDISHRALDNGIRLAINALAYSYNFRVNVAGGHRYYYFYTVERAAALNHLDTINNRDWFAEGSTILLAEQIADGSWKSGDGHDPSGTCFAILFLVRATAKLVKPLPVLDPTAGGLMAGGRGLPDDLTSMSVKAGEVVVNEEDGTTLKSLLEQMQKVDLTTPEEVNQLQQQLVELARTTSREELINQWDRLVQFAEADAAELRKTAAWALGRSERKEALKYLVNMLSDPDAGVVIEARNALCWISRKPSGFNHTDNPWAGVAANADEQRRIDAFEQWRKNVKNDWEKWYYKTRPYEYRDTLDDPHQMIRKKRAGVS